jgi:acetolactate synthase-1/2/3 large subunit
VLPGGPGATNLVTGLATAQMDSVPVVAITRPGAHQAVQHRHLQESDVVGRASLQTNYILVTNVNRTSP